VVDTEGFLISSDETFQQDPDVIFDGLRYMVVWEDRRGSYPAIYGARVHPAGIVIDKDGLPISNIRGHQGRPAVTFDGANYMVVWQNGDRDPTRIFGARVDPSSGAVLDMEGMPVSAWPHAQYSPVVTPGPSGQILAAYSSFVPPSAYGSSRIFASILSIPSDGSPVEIAAAPNPFRTTVSIGFRLPAGSKIRLSVHDAAGRLVRTVARGYRGPGWHHESWNGRDEEGRSVPDGIYFTRIQSKFGKTGTKCILVR
jgi:hypothetical protein